MKWYSIRSYVTRNEHCLNTYVFSSGVLSMFDRAAKQVDWSISDGSIINDE